MAKRQKKKAGSIAASSAETPAKGRGEEKVDEWTEHSHKKQRQRQKHHQKPDQQEEQGREGELLQPPDMSLPLNLNHPVIQNPLEGAAFLDTIPEDTSVAAGAGAIHRPALSTASAVASSDDEELARGNRKTGSDLSTGAAVGGDDAAGKRRKAARIAKRKSRFLLYYALIGFLLLAVAIGIFFVLKGDHQKMMAPAPSPTNFTSSPGEPSWLDSEAPTAVPVWDAKDVRELDEALLAITPDQREFSNQATPQATCRNWFLTGSLFHSNFTVQLVGMERVQQRYILCVLYHSTAGLFWDTSSSYKGSTSFLDANADECDWDGVICPEDNTETVTGLFLQNANLAGTLPAELAYLKQITYLQIDENPRLVGTIPSNFLSQSFLPGLITLDLSHNSLTGKIPEPTSVSNSLKNVFVNDNELTGSIPFFGGNMKKLYAFNNMLSTFPSDEYASVESLKSILLFNNSLTGTLSQGTWATPNLEVLDVAGNSLVGRIPQSLWQLPSLKELILNHNQFRDTLPPQSVTTGRAFEVVWLQSNQLAGTIPVSFGAGWTNLTSLILQNNNLSGVIPCSNFAAVDSEAFQLEADCALSTLSCTCCSTCYPHT